MFDEDLAWLGAVYIESRYPDDFEDINLEDAQRVIETASEFEKFIIGKFNVL